MRICEHCLMALQSRGEVEEYKTVYIDEEDGIICEWCEEEILDYYAVAQCTPGVIAVNTATFIGQKQKGIQ